MWFDHDNFVDMQIESVFVFISSQNRRLYQLSPRFQLSMIRGRRLSPEGMFYSMNPKRTLKFNLWRPRSGIARDWTNIRKINLLDGNHSIFCRTKHFTSFKCFPVSVLLLQQLS